ncbi:hypothetical protein [Mycobacterium sp. DL592]|uniref:hypothetical protein n=1 Tax=Mycobacterium sp. DL592 TaxID=2675524 RepID=UPI0014233C55|nr:hypothetical protein [Mycobacterium sp. DL592]
MPRGPHVPSISHIRKALDEVAGATRYDDPSTDKRGTGADPAMAVWISDPERQGNAGYAMDADPDAGLDADTDSSDTVVDEPVVVFEIPPQVTESEIHHVLGDDQLTKIEQLAQLSGSDVYGWYTTFHQKRFQYGVHIPFEGILAFALHACADVNVSLERKLHLAYHAILRHELFHFNVDCMIANWELTTGAPVYWNAKERYREPHGYVTLEEGLANAYMLRGFKHRSRPLANSVGAYQALKRFCKRQPEGYRDAEQYVRTRGPYGRMDSFFDASCELSVQYQHESKPLWVPPDHALDTLMFYPDLIHIDWTRCPIIILDEHNLRGALGIGISFFQVITDIKQTEDFSKTLKRLDRSIQKRWQNTVDKLALSTALNGLGFQPWKKDGRECYSVNVGGNFRAHLRYDRSGSTWYAESIGDHKEMGHG